MRVIRGEPRARLHEIQRALTHLIVDAPQILPNNPEHEQLHAADEENRRDRRSPSMRGGNFHEPGDERPEDEQESDPGGEKSAPRRGPQGE